jgi:hypothetical protein
LAHGAGTGLDPRAAWRSAVFPSPPRGDFALLRAVDYFDTGNDHFNEDSFVSLAEMMSGSFDDASGIGTARSSARRTIYCHVDLESTLVGALSVSKGGR